MEFQTRLIHSHQEPESQTGAVTVPIFQSSTFARKDFGAPEQYVYSRYGNPTTDVLENVLAEVEHGTKACCYTSGMGAISTVMQALLRPGDHMLMENNVYIGSNRLFTEILPEMGVETNFVDLTDLSRLEAALREDTRLIYIESPTNPMLRLVDLKALTAITKPRGILTVIDNTLATPWIQNPLDLGIDVVLHSTTKYIGGHSDVLGGAVITKDTELGKKIKYFTYALGATADPFASWLILRGLKTLGVRMAAHCNNAMQLAQYLEAHPGIESVIYPGLPSHPQHELAKRQMRAFGGMIAIKVKGDLAITKTFVHSLKYFIPAASLGGVESLVDHPPISTHVGMTQEQWDSMGMSDNMVRLSVGLEDIDDLKADMDQALKSAGAA